jgi:hypothetical protein
MQNTYVGLLKGHGSSGSVGESFSKSAIKIVRHFGFELCVASYVERCSSAQSDEVGAGAVKPEIIYESSDLNMVLSPYGGRQTQTAN